MRKQTDLCAHLPQDTFLLLLQHLPCLSDLQASRQVSKSWRDAVDASVTSVTTSASQFPGLLLDFVDNCGDTFYFHVIKDGCFVTSDQWLYKRPVRYMDHGDKIFRCSGCSVIGSIGGWLITREWNINYLLNPVSGTGVMLPRQFTTSSRLPSFVKVVASSEPSKHNRHCLMGGIYWNNLVALCRLSGTSWTLTDNVAEDIEIVDGKLYALTRELNVHYVLVVYDILEHGDDLKLVKLSELRIDFSLGGRKRHTYLVKDTTTDELFVVGQNLGPADCGGMKTVGFHLLKVDGPELVEVSDLGDRMLFVGDNNNMFVPYTSASAIEFERNSIYFASADHSCSCGKAHGDSGVYSLTRKENIPLVFPLRRHLRINNGMGQSIWFTPRKSFFNRNRTGSI